MSTEEAKKSWAKSQTGCKVGKEFEHEMLIRTSERRTAKHLINKSGDGMMLSITNEDGTVTPIDESYLANPIDVHYTIDAEFMNEDISKESARFEPTEADVISADDLKLETITPVMDAPDGAIEIPYAEYKNKPFDATLSAELLTRGEYGVESAYGEAEYFENMNLTNMFALAGNTTTALLLEGNVAYYLQDNFKAVASLDCQFDLTHRKNVYAFSIGFSCNPFYTDWKNLFK